MEDLRFDAAKAGRPELDNMSLTHLITTLFTDINEGNFLRHGFWEGLKDHGPSFAYTSLRKKSSAKQQGFTVEEAVYSKYRDIVIDLYEIADRLQGTDYSAAQKIHDYADNLQDDTGILAYETRDVMYEIVNLLSHEVIDKNQGKIKEYTQFLNAVAVSKNRHKHMDLRRELNRKHKRLNLLSEDKHNLIPDIDEDKFWQKQFTERIEDTIRSIGNIRLPRFGRIHPFFIASGIAIAFSVGAYNIANNVVEDRLKGEDLQRTLMCVPEDAIPEYVKGLSDIYPLGLDARNLSCAFDELYMAANRDDLPFTMPNFGMRGFKDWIGRNIELANSVLAQYQDEGLNAAVKKVFESGRAMTSAVGHSVHEDTRVETYWEPVQHCTGYGDDRSCHTDMEMRTRIVCDNKDHTFTYNDGIATDHLNNFLLGFNEATVFNDQHLSQIILMSIAQYGEGGTFAAYTNLVNARNSIPGLISAFNAEHEGYPDSWTEWNYSCSGTPFDRATQLMNQFHGAATNINNIKRIGNDIIGYLNSLNTAMDRLDKDQIPEDIFEDPNGPAASSIDFLRDFDFPEGQGHKYFNEITEIAKLWAIGAAIVGSIAGFGGTYLFTQGQWGARVNDYWDARYT